MNLADTNHALRRTRRVLLKRGQYFLMRHISARTPEERRLLREGPRVFANSIPKAGTNLLARLMQMMPNTIDRLSYHIDETLAGIERQLRAGRCGQVVTAHLPWSEWVTKVNRDLGYRMILMVRDPRDIAVSNVNYVTRMDTSHPLHRVMARLADDDARLLSMIDPPAAVLAGLPEVWKNDGLSSFLPWLDEPDCLLVRFEDLVGAKGGGSDERQRETIQQIADHIGAKIDAAFVDKTARELFGNAGSKTFNKGQIGNWRAHFKPSHIAAFKRRSNETLERLGYEKSQDW